MTIKVGAPVIWVDPDGDENKPGRIAIVNDGIVSLDLDNGGYADVYAEELIAA